MGGVSGGGKGCTVPDCEQKRETRPRDSWKGEGDIQQPSLGELYRGRFVQRLNLNPPQVCTVFYAIEIISAFHLLSSDSAKQI